MGSCPITSGRRGSSVGEIRAAFQMSRFSMREHHLWSAKNFLKFWSDIAHHEITIKGNERLELELAYKGLQEDAFRMLLSEK